MRPLSTQQLLNLWEQGLAQPLAHWALLVLAAACPETPAEHLAELSIGARDGRLLTLYEWIFGPNLVGLVACPVCREKLELSFQVDDIRARSDEVERLSPIVLRIEGYEVRFRLPNSLDVTAVDNPDALFQQCVLQVTQNGQEQPLEGLPEGVVTAVITHMAQADPQADVQLALTCLACQHAWQATFDIITFFWHELNAWACRMLHEIHILAAAYGWCEADILALTSWRRHFYLQMIHNR